MCLYKASSGQLIGGCAELLLLRPVLLLFDIDVAVDATNGDDDCGPRAPTLPKLPDRTEELLKPHPASSSSPEHALHLIAPASTTIPRDGGSGGGGRGAFTGMGPTDPKWPVWSPKTVNR